jgi:predicted DNA-binding transcriptional regulator AlpA
MFDEHQPSHLTAQELAGEVAILLTQRMTAMDTLKLLGVTFLEVAEVAHLLRVKERTIYSWISQDRIPVRYANGKPIFLLSELIQWTLPENDKHTKHRLPLVNHSKIAVSRLAAIRERTEPRVS